MHKSKKKSTKMVKIPKPIKIKKEKTEEDRTPQPMSHYVDDRLELIKQIFGTLKPKTITNLAPDFLKKKDLEDIQENCLNELLGISKKRLLSIIAATKCPTDTESSSDSDVNNIEEHVSLEEISSDSEIGEGGAKTSKKKTSANGGGKGGTKKNGVKNGAEKDKNSGQISVLELLELQARARAIRSQLALEPVTKIEVDSDNDTDEKSSTKSQENQSGSRKERKRKSDEHAKTLKKTKTNGVSTTTAVPDKTLKVIRPTVEPTKKIKLKRNFRTNVADLSETTEHVKKPEDEPKTTATTNNLVKEEKRSRSVSPDVVPIVAEPVTLMISDSSDDEIGQKTKTTTLQQELKKTEEVQSSKIAPEQEAINQTTNSEQEDGEILDETELRTQNNIEQNNVTDDDADKAKNKKTTDDCNNDKGDSNANSESTATVSTAEVSIEPNATETTEEIIKIAIENDSKEPQSTTAATSETVPTPAPEIKTLEDEYDDDQNDDVISIEGGDLESEMTEHLEKDNSNAESSQSSSTACNKETEETATEQTTANATQVEKDDIISLNSSDDELTKQSSESWNSRWLKSSKVSKVLATSRLGKRVRDKIKKTKRTKKDMTREATEAAANAEANKNNSAYTSKHEDGSIDQYKELLEMRQQRKN